MIKRIRIDYSAPHRPGIPVIVCNALGQVVFEREGMELTKKDRRRAAADHRKEVQLSVRPEYITGKEDCKCRE